MGKPSPLPLPDAGRFGRSFLRLEEDSMKKISKTVAVALAALLGSAAAAVAQNENQGQGQAVVTVLPKKDNVPQANVTEQQVSVEVGGKKSQILNWQPYRGSNAGAEVVLLIDDGARASLGREWDDITQFVRGLPPDVSATIGYMDNGRAALAGPLTTDHARVLQQLHLPIGVGGVTASPYFCLSDLAKHWPSTNRNTRREVIMITDGVDNYERRYDPEDPYVQAAIQDSVRANLVVYSIYWRSVGRANNGWYETNAGQNLLNEVTTETGGNSWWIGFGNPVTLRPYFDDFDRRLSNQYELGYAAPSKGKAEIVTLKVKVGTPDTKVTAPQQTLVAPSGSARE